MRHVESEDVKEELQDLDVESALKLPPVKREGVREDIKAAEYRSKAAQAASVQAREESMPTLNATASYALYKRDADRGTAMNDPFSLDHPYWQVALNLSMPFDVSTQSALRQARNQERDAADLTFQNVNYNSEREWVELSRKHKNYKNELELASALETTQKEKLTHEKSRLEHGRTTTYQVLQFEQDYSNAVLNRLQVQTKYLQNYVKMKLWSSL
jgi:outer membrane protein TolC